MSYQKTLSIIKPDAVKAGHVDAINLLRILRFMHTVFYVGLLVKLNDKQVY